MEHVSLARRVQPVKQQEKVKTRAQTATQASTPQRGAPNVCHVLPEPTTMQRQALSAHSVKLACLQIRKGPLNARTVSQEDMLLILDLMSVHCVLQAHILMPNKALNAFHVMMVL